MNLLGFRTAIEHRTGVAMLQDAQTELVNEALYALSTEFDWPWLTRTHTFTTTGADDYSLPFDATRLRYVSVGDREYKRGDVVDSTNTALPWQWAVWGDRLVLPVSTGQTVTVRYHGVEDELIQDSDEPLLPVEYHPALVEYAVAQVLDRTANTPTERARVTNAQLNYQNWLRRMRRGASRVAGPRAARVRPGSML